MAARGGNRPTIATACALILGLVRLDLLLFTFVSIPIAGLCRFHKPRYGEVIPDNCAAFLCAR
jgi:hypothetical protein